jgi:hypothetical protein
MGVGYALASGLVQGFTQNIGMRSEERKAEKARLNALNSAVITAGLGDDFNNKNVDAITAYIQEGRKALEEQGGIDIFGTYKGDVITEEDTMSLLGSLQTTAKTEDKIDPKWFVGSDDTRINFYNDDFSGSGNSARALFSQIEPLLRSEESLTKLITDPDAYKQLDGRINNGRLAIMAENAKVPEDERLVIQWDAKEYSWMDNWRKLGRRIGVPSITDTAAATQVIKGMPGGERAVGAWSVDLGDGSKEYGPVILNTDGQAMAYDHTGKFLSSPSPEGVFGEWEDAVDLPGKDPKLKVTYFASAINAGDIPDIDGLQPQKSLYTLDNYDSVYTQLEEHNATGTFENGVFMLVPHMWSPQTGMSTGGSSPYEVVNFAKESKSEYVLKMYYGKSVYKTKSFDTLLKDQQANASVVEQIDQLAELRKNEGDAVAYSKFKQIFRIAGDITRSAIRDLGVSDEALDGLGEADFAAFQGLVDDARKRGEATGQGLLFAQSQSLRIALAFKMARAADPSGRLSNQDIIQQLERLGGDFDTADQVLAKLSIVREEFANQAAQLDVLVRYGRGEGELTRFNKGVIDAAIAYDHVTRQALSERGAARGGGSFANFKHGEESRSLVTQGGLPLFLLYDDPDPLKGKQRDGYFTKEEDGTFKLYDGQVVRKSKQGGPSAQDDTIAAGDEPSATVTKTGGGSQAELTLQPNNATAAAPAPAAAAPQPELGPMEGKMFEAVSGNNIAGFVLKDTSTGEQLPGKYSVVNGRYERIRETEGSN